MKITIEVDCTPDEARQFLGLPDVKPLQAAALARLEKRMAEAAEALAPDALMKAWLSVWPQSPEHLRDTLVASFGSLLGKAGAGPTPGGTETSR